MIRAFPVKTNANIYPRAYTVSVYSLFKYRSKYRNQITLNNIDLKHIPANQLNLKTSKGCY